MEHRDKIRFHNDVADFTRRMRECYEANRKACELLEREVKDLTEEKMKEVLWKMKRWDDAHDMEI